jgi:hypothetical protein
VPAKYPGMSTIRGGDGKRYAFRVREIRTWLMNKLSKPQFDHKKAENADFDKTTLKAIKGIIGFDIHFSDATGHLDLWDGLTFSSEHSAVGDYWKRATRIWVWQAL